MTRIYLLQVTFLQSDLEYLNARVDFCALFFLSISQTFQVNVPFFLSSATIRIVKGHQCNKVRALLVRTALIFLMMEAGTRQMFNYPFRVWTKDTVVLEKKNRAYIVSHLT